MRGLGIGFGLLVVACSVDDGESAPVVSEPNAAQLWAERVCAVRAQCECASHESFDLAECELRLATTFNANQASAMERGLTYDPTCVPAQTEELERIACDTPQEFESSCGGCKVYHGDKAVGEPCEGGLVAHDNCRQGLACIDDVCAESCNEVGLDGTCFDANTLADCEGDLICDVTFDGEQGVGICRQPVAEGEACGEGRPCEFGLGCEASVCAPLAALGGACDVNANCASGLCRDMICAPQDPLICWVRTDTDQ